MKRVDDRTSEQMKTHNWLITATDRFMSGWGECNGGVSKCAWACKPEHVDKLQRWVSDRSDMKYVNVTNNKWYPKNAMHVHVYVVDENHPALN